MCYSCAPPLNFDLSPLPLVKTGPIKDNQDIQDILQLSFKTAIEQKDRISSSLCTRYPNQDCYSPKPEMKRSCWVPCRTESERVRLTKALTFNLSTSWSHESDCACRGSAGSESKRKGESISLLLLWGKKGGPGQTLVTRP